MPGPNCLLGICCPPKSPSAKQALMEEICAGLGWTTPPQHQAAKDVSEWLLENYDLAPAHTLTKLFEAVATYARENP